ncbi:flagellin [uncultured Methylobacterium sp.]|uniref:flagellin N-terminal helical domain-containing protein n=1 Tax=uncultured Methylobacterium sp. TaxID=157278 RepID=UPI0026397FC0|nr:flagellin [uncultured Methylobacterium sp.]
MTSILTNNSAIIALQTLSSINKDLDTTSNRISTGQRISSAADGAAYWSIAQTLRSDNGSLSAVTDAMRLDANSVKAAAGGVNQITENLTTIKNKLVNAISTNVDRATTQNEIKDLLRGIKTTADNTVMNGSNWLSVDSSRSDFSDQIGLVSAFSRNNGTVTVSTSNLDTGSFIIYDSNASGTSNTSLTSAFTAIASSASVSGSNGATVAVTGTAADKKGFLDTTYVITPGASGASAIVQSIKDFDISSLGKDDTAQIQAYIKIIDATILKLQSGSSSLGSTSTLIASQQDFTKKLSDINTSSIGALVDADMEEESTRLKALQTQQQLGIQSLSISNSASQNILSLFR